VEAIAEAENALLGPALLFVAPATAEGGVKAVFVESSVAPKNVQAIVEGAKSRGHDVNVGGELFSDAMGAGGTYEGTYIGMIDHNITIVVNALGGQAPTQGWQGKLSTKSK